MAAKQLSLMELISEELTCPICLHRLKDPKVLPCLHTFCKDCLMAATREKTIAICPKCRETHPLPEGGVGRLLTNFTANSLLELLQVHEAEENKGDKKKKLRCENGLDENDAVARCMDCNIYLCDTCWTLHKKQVMSRKHKTVSLSQIKDAGEKCLQKPHYCSNHEGELLKLYCNTCSVAICGDCTYVEHRDHKYVFIKDVQSELRKQLETAVSGLAKKEAKLNMQLESLYKLDLKQKTLVESCKEEIAEKAAEMRRKIDIEEAEAMKAADNVLHTRQKAIKAEEDSVSLSLAKVSNNLSFMQRLLKSGSDIEIASAAAQATERSKHVGALGEQAAEIKSAQLLCTSELTCKIYVQEIKLEVKGLDDLARGPNNVTVLSATKPRVDELTLTPTDGKPMNVNHTLSRVKYSEWNIQFTLHEAGSCQFKVTADESSVQKTIKIIDKMCMGKQVRRGPDWEWGEQDGHGTGTVLDTSGEGWVKVKWDNGITYKYRWGSQNVFDLVIIV